MRVLVVSNMAADEAHPGRGSFVRNQVAALRALSVDAELYEFAPGRRRYPDAVGEIRRLLRRGAFDLVHAHFGLAGWCARLAGARPLVVTFHGTDVRHPVTGALSRRLVSRVELAAGAARSAFGPEGGRPGLPRPRRGRARIAVLPCGADLDRFRPGDRARARDRLGLERDGRYLLFAANPDRRVKRFDRAREVAELADARLLHAGSLDGDTMPDWFNAANAVLVPSDNEGFGLVAVEALACDVPVLSTPVGIAPVLLAGLPGCLAQRYDASTWARAARRHLDAADPRVDGRARARWFSSRALAERVLVAYRELLEPPGETPVRPR